MDKQISLQFTSIRNAKNGKKKKGSQEKALKTRNRMAMLNRKKVARQFIGKQISNETTVQILDNYGSRKLGKGSR